MATVTFSAAGETLYAYLAGEIDHDAAQSLRMQLDDALVSRSPRTLIVDLEGWGSWIPPASGLFLGGSAAPAFWARACGCSRPAQLQSPAAGRHPLYGEHRKGECAMKSREQYPHPVRFPQQQ